MLFSSVEFLYYFLPVTLILYFAVPFKLKNLVLLVASLFFYFYGEPIYMLMMLGTSLYAYILGLLIDRFRNNKFLSKLFLVLSVAGELAVLGVFKYSDFFIENVNALIGGNIKLLGLALPIGISFYTFQTLSYTVDVYRGEAKVQKSFIKLATYITLFPQLIAGPIVRYTTIEKELTARTHSFENFSYGATRFIIGLSKKILIANVLGELVADFKASGEQSVLYFWLYAVSYSLHIYFDFSGYSDMAIGLGRMFGFHFLENFNYPFISKTATEFWRRWHMSLGSWFRDYVYIPLGGNRAGKMKHLFNILVVWALTGVWHGADWNFIIWGLMFALILTLEKFFYGKKLEKIPVLSHVYMFIIILVSFVIFDATSVHDQSGAILKSSFDIMAQRLGGMFGAGDVPLVSEQSLYALRSYGFVIVIGILGSTPLIKKLVEKAKASPVGAKIINVLTPVTVAALLVVVTAYLADGSFNPFLYFRF